MTDTLTHEALGEHLGTKFEVQLEPDKILELELTEISKLKKSERHEQFSIVFLGPNDILLEQGIHQMKHDTFGECELFIVPISQDDRGCRYEAVFNRLRGSNEASV